MSQSQSIKNINLECELHFAHIDGHTELDFIVGENKLVTAGVDCEVRLWSLDDGEIIETFTVDDSVYSVVANKERFFVALANNCVKSYQLKDGENESTLCRFTANSTHLSLHSDHALIVASGADFCIKLHNMDDQSEKLFEGHTGPVLSVALDPLCKYIASSSCDGSVALWTIDSRKMAFQWRNVLSRSNDFENSSSLCRIAWKPTLGEILAVPKVDSLELYKRGQWDKPWKRCTHPDLKELSIAAFSRDGQFIATSSTQSMVVVWRLADLQLLAVMYSIGSCITSLKFNPLDSSQFCCCDKSGSLRILKILSLTSKSSTLTEVKKGTDFNKEIEDMLDSTDLFDDIDDDELGSLTSKNECQLNTVKTNTTTVEEIIDISTSNTTVHKQSKQFNNLNNDLDTDIGGGGTEFDIGAIKSQYEPMIFGNDIESTTTSLKKSTSTISSSVMSSTNKLVIDGHQISGKELLALVQQHKSATLPTRQPAFQSGSTPVHYHQRFMVWNSVGIVYSYNTDEERSIDVEFHDVSFHHSIHLVNMFNYTMADLSNACLVLASNGDDEAEDELDHRKARLFCMLFSTWDTIKEWTICLDQEEQFDSIAVGQTFIAAATSQLYLRVWTIGGVQTSIISLNGPAVNLSAYDRFVMVLYHQAVHYTEHGQSIACQVLKVDHKGKTRCHPIPSPMPVALSPRATVYWAGFTDEGTPAVVDSDGIVRLYKSHFGNGWHPVCATKTHANGRSDNFFIIGLSEIQAQIRCIYCKASRYPDTVPKPTLTILPFQIPLCEMFTSKAKHEEECIRSRWLASLLKKLSTDGYDVDNALEDADKKTINSLIKLFALSLAAERESLALEIAGIMPNRAALEGAVRYAERQKHRSLAMKLIEMIKDDEDNDSDDERNSDTELQELILHKGTDRLRQLINDDGSGSKQVFRHVPLTKHGDLNEDMTALKPKKMQNGRILQEEPSAMVIEEENVIEIDDDDSSDELKPKQFNVNSKNPFKIKKNTATKNQRIREASCKRKQFEVETLEEEDDADSMIDNEDGENSHQSTVHLNKEMQEDSEEETETVAVNRKSSKTKSTKLGKIKRAKSDKDETTVVDKPTNKITNFFKRN